MVLCKMKKCPYNQNEKFCQKQYVTIDLNGCCEVLWAGGRPKQNLPNEKEIKNLLKRVKLIDAEYEEQKQQKEEKAGQLIMLEEKQK